MVKGSLFDLNAYYAKRLIGRVVPDNTIARQLPFFSRFSTTKDFLPFSGYTFVSFRILYSKFFVKFLGHVGSWRHSV